MIKGQTPKTRGNFGNIQIDSVDTNHNALPRPAGINAFWVKERSILQRSCVVWDSETKICGRASKLFEIMYPLFNEMLQQT